ncbi:MAG: iron-containing alcohol dehydrogenase [Candidatus Izemoplasma sp.]|nr:iron-containing alcohol dehydrogenase [Candidatus Izemoplasma sp.]
MDNFKFYSPTEFIFGQDVEKDIGKRLKKEGVNKVFFHYGGGSIKKTGLYDTVVNALNEEKIEFVELGGVKPNPVDSLVYEGIELCQKENVDFVLAVGGGSVIDSAKAIAAGVKYDGDFWDFYDRKAVVEEALPVGVILTIPAAGSEGSSATVITKESEGLKRGMGSDLLRPVFSFINPELTYTLPMWHTAAGISDMMAHIFERYISNSKDVVLTDRLMESTLISIMEAARVIVTDPNNYEARATICWAGTIAHNGILGVGREEEWTTHGLEHELSALYDMTHGAGLAVIFPAYMRYTLNQDVDRYYRLATEVFGVPHNYDHKKDVAEEGILRLVGFFKEIGMPTTLEEADAKKEDIPKLIEKLKINRGESFGNFMTLTLDDARKIYELASEKQVYTTR